MPKLKARKAVAKRFKLTGSGKVSRRKSNQNHFNARQTSEQKRSKRGNEVVSTKYAHAIKEDILK